MKFEFYHKVLSWKKDWLFPAKKYIDIALSEVNKKLLLLEGMKIKVDKLKEKSGSSKRIENLYQEFLDFSRRSIILKGELLVQRRQVVDKLKMANGILKLSIPIETRRQIDKLDREMNINPENFKEINSKKDKILRPYVEEKGIDETYASTVEKNIVTVEKELLSFSDKMNVDLREYNEIFEKMSYNFREKREK